MHRTTGLLVCAAGVLGAAVLSPPASSAGGDSRRAGADGGRTAGDCRAVRLPVPDWAEESEVSTGSPSGKAYAGNGYTARGPSRPLIWHGGDVHKPDIDVPQPEITAINSKGLVVGFGLKRGDTNDRVPFAYRNGRSWRLPALIRRVDATVTAVSENGRKAVGSEAIYRNGRYVRTVAVMWSGKRLQNVHRLPRRTGYANGIDHGTVVGSARGRAHLWRSDGRNRFLPRPDNTTRRSSEATAIRGRFATGTTYRRSDGSVETLWNLRRGTVRELPALNAVYDVNRSGAVAASTRGPNGDAAIVKRGRVRRLPTLGGSSAAFTISDRAVAAGLSRSNGDAQAVVWRGCR